MHGCPNRTSGLNRGKKLLPLPLPGIDTVIQLIVVVVFFFPYWQSIFSIRMAKNAGCLF